MVYGSFEPQKMTPDFRFQVRSLRDNLDFGLYQAEVRRFLSSFKSPTGVESDSSFLDSSLTNYSPKQVRQILVHQGFSYPKEAARLSFMMCKGGVGKTTIAYFLGLKLAAFGARVLFIDSDPQANLTMTLRKTNPSFDLDDQTPVIADVLTKRVPLDRATISLHPNLHLVPSTAVNSILERMLLKTRNPIARLDLALLGVRHKYDYILIDCAPSLNIFNASVAYASDHLIAPFQLNEFSRLGLQQTVCEITELQKRYRFQTNIKILLNGYRGTIAHEGEFIDQIATNYRTHLMNTFIHQSVEIQKALNTGALLTAARSSKARNDFNKLAIEALKSLGSRHG